MWIITVTMTKNNRVMMEWAVGPFSTQGDTNRTCLLLRDELAGVRLIESDHSRTGLDAVVTTVRAWPLRHPDASLVEFIQQCQNTHQTMTTTEGK